MYLSISSGAPGADRRRALDVRGELAFVVDDLHPAPAQHVRRPHQDRETDLARDRARLAKRVGGAAARAGDAELLERGVELLAVLGHVERTPVAADDRDPAPGELAGEVDRGLAAEREHHAARAGRARGRLDLVGARRLEHQHVAHVEVGRDRLGVVVDDDRGATGLAQRPRRVHARVVELDALADADRAAADHDHGLAVRRTQLVLFAPRKIIVGRHRGKLGRGGVDHAKRARRRDRGAGLSTHRVSRSIDLVSLSFNAVGLSFNLVSLSFNLVSLSLSKAGDPVSR